MKASLLALMLMLSPLGLAACYPMEDWEALSTNGKDTPKDAGKGDDGDGKFELVGYKVIFKPGESGYSFFRIPAAVRTSEGTLLCFAEGRVDGRSDFGNIDLVLKRSEDNGATWGDLIVVRDDGKNRCCNPVPVALDGGKVLLVYCWNLDGASSTQKVYTVFSDDDGKTWGDSAEITPQILRDGESGYMTGPVHGIVKKYAPAAGRIIVPARCRSPYDKPAHVIYSDDGGKTWKKGASASYTHENENTVTELANGDILMNMRDYNTAGTSWFRWDAVSSDGGLTFGTARMTSLVEPKNGCEGALLTLSDDTARGVSTVLFSNPSHISSRRWGSVKISYDNGKTWPAMCRYTDETGDGMYSAYSDLVLLDGGKAVGIIYEAGYNNGGGIVFKSINASSIKDEYKY